jgi:peptidoglycan/LPS O-acetylase OafA/YrhL
MIVQQKNYYPQLDAIRGLSFLAVFICHAYHPLFSQNLGSSFLKFIHENLFLSIDVFFILSSFLLTWLGMQEYKREGAFSFYKYFVRRALRIWPLYFFIMLLAFVVLPFFAKKMNINVSLPPAYYYLFFVSNFYLKEHVYFLRFLWTLSVEEQFYLFWGICLTFGQKKIKLIALTIFLISIFYTLFAINNNQFYDFNTLTYLIDFSIGILAAYAIQKQSAIAVYLSNISKKKSAFLLLFLPILFTSFFLANHFLNHHLVKWSNFIMRILFLCYVGFFIIEQMVNPNVFIKLIKNKFLIYTGKISFGLYCFHGIVITFTGMLLGKLNIALVPSLFALICFLLNYSIAMISYNGIEKPFLKLKEKFR